MSSYLKHKNLERNNPDRHLYQCKSNSYKTATFVHLMIRTFIINTTKKMYTFHKTSQDIL